MRKIAVITGSRADESPLSNVIKLLGANGVHIRTDGLYGHEEPLKTKLQEIKPNIVLLLGDRYETLVAASVAALLTIPIAHIHGGEETEGAVDNAFRHAITKLSYWHFTVHQDYADRVIQMGESPDRVFVTGAPGMDQFAHLAMTKEEMEIELGIEIIQPLALVCYHPETLGMLSCQEQQAQMFSKLQGATVIICGSNEDDGGTYITASMVEFASKTPNVFFRHTYGPHLWSSLMRHADVLIGNSSCFIIEGMTLGKKVINIGDRQKGRYEAALKHFAADRYAYGKPGEVSPKIAELLMTLPIPEKPRKAFHDINY